MAIHTSAEEETAALYALGALGAHELADFEAHLAHCARCQWIVSQDYAALTELDPMIPDRESPPGFKAQLLARAAREPVPGEAAPEPRARTFDWGLLFRRAAPLAALVVLVLSLGLIVGTQLTLDQDLVSAPLQGTAGGDSTVLVHRSGAAQVSLRGLPMPPPGHIYQAWVVEADGRRDPAGTYDEGDGTFALDRPALGQTVEITVEPAPGSAAQTTAPILSGYVAP
jgi:anti-sigma-K factor RskA